jgi:nitrate reductase NapE component
MAAEFLAISSGLSSASNGELTAQPCTLYTLSYVLGSDAQPYQSEINLRSADIACNITTDAQFWEISPMLQPGPNGSISWRFGNDVPAGKQYRLEISDQNGVYAMTDPFLVVADDSSDSASDDTCSTLIPTDPTYHLPLDERQSIYGSLDSSSPDWRSCVPASYLNSNDLTPVPAADAADAVSSDSHHAPVFWFCAIGIPIIAVALLGSLGWTVYARKRRARKTARSSVAVNRALRSSISKPWPPSSFGEAPPAVHPLDQLEKGGDDKDAFYYPPNYRSSLPPLFRYISESTNAIFGQIPELFEWESHRVAKESCSNPLRRHTYPLKAASPCSVLTSFSSYFLSWVYLAFSCPFLSLCLCFVLGLPLSVSPLPFRKEVSSLRLVSVSVSLSVPVSVSVCFVSSPAVFPPSWVSMSDCLLSILPMYYYTFCCRITSPIFQMYLLTNISCR